MWLVYKTRDDTNFHSLSSRHHKKLFLNSKLTDFSVSFAKMKFQVFVFLSVALVVNAANPKLLRPNPRYSFEERIVGGDPVDVKDHPHQVSLQSWGHFCGGSLVSKE